jgi:predicted alpha/beta superfamily hydrolase
VKLVLHVQVPASTPASEPVFLTGDLKTLGGWSPRGLRLRRISDRAYTITLPLEKGTEIRFKFTRGSWATVEKGPSFEEIPNRHLRAEEKTIRLSVANWADFAPAARRHTRTGRIVEHNGVAASRLGNRRTVLVYLPESYDEAPKRRYPVLYMHDGQNVFDAATSFAGVDWGADETAERLTARGAMREIIIIAVYNTPEPGRENEYTPWKDPRQGRGGRAADYAHFLIHELKPFIDRTYRTLRGRRDTAVMGSSLGGLVSLYLGWTHPETFSMVAAISPSLWWADRAMIKAIEASGGKVDLRIWLDMGTEEGPKAKGDPGRCVKDLRGLKDILLSRGYVLGEDLGYFEDPGGKHHESAWAKRLWRPLLFLFGRNTGKEEEAKAKAADERISTAGRDRGGASGK